MGDLLDMDPQGAMDKHPLDILQLLFARKVKTVVGGQADGLARGSRLRCRDVYVSRGESLNEELAQFLITICYRHYSKHFQMKILKYILNFFLSLKTALWFLGFLLFFLFAGALIMPGRPEFELLHSIPFFEWIQKQHVGITWWLWGVI
jgi:hypothetical protein